MHNQNSFQTLVYINVIKYGLFSKCRYDLVLYNVNKINLLGAESSISMKLIQWYLVN